jgi:large subunit ribosomal protein L17
VSNEKNWTDEHDVVRKLFDKIVPKLQNRQGGYTRIVKLAGARKGDAAQLAYLTWVFDDTVASTSEKSEETESNVVESQVEEEVKENKNADEVVGENNESENNADDGDQAEQQK